MRNKSVSVKQLNDYIKNVFEDELVLQNITVIGEVFDVSVSKYVFLTLKEDDCILQCISFSKISPPKTGQKVALTGSVNFSERYSKISFVFKSLIDVREGEKQAALEAVKKRLKEKGYFDRKKPLPQFIKSVCVITSGYGSVIHDFLSGISAHSYIDVAIYPCSVQGDNAEKELLDNLTKADSGKFDAVVIARGGGSKEDLACFNLESVALAVGDMKTPSVSAVGHETDYTLCDACADVRAGTPSFAAKIICENNDKYIGKFLSFVQKLGVVLNDKYKRTLDSVMLLSNKIVYSADKEFALNKAKVRLLSDKASKAIGASAENSFRKVEHCADSIKQITENKLSVYDRLLSDCVTKLEYLSPLKTLGRGYSVVSKNGKTIKSVKEVKKNDRIEITVFDGKYFAVAGDGEKNHDI